MTISETDRARIVEAILLAWERPRMHVSHTASDKACDASIALAAALSAGLADAIRERALREAEARVKELEGAVRECVAVIKFAIDLDDHYDRLEFLKGWNEGDTSEWPEFRAALSPAPAQEQKHD
jgi:hypothetical protein